MANGSCSIHIKPWGDSYKTVTAAVTSQDHGMAPWADEIGIMTRIHQGMASALTVKLQHKLGDSWVDVTGATGNTVVSADASTNAEVNFATKPNSGTLRVNISTATLYSAQTVASAAIANATDTFTKNGHGYANGVPVTVSTSNTLPAGLTAGTTYYVQIVDANSFKLCATYAAATGAGAVVNLTSDGVGDQTVTPLPLIVDARIIYGRRS